MNDKRLEETLGDRVSTHRGMAIMVYNVQGKKLGKHSAETQDFVFASNPTFPSGTAKGFLRDGTVIGKSAGLPEAVKSAVAAGARTFNRILHSFGGESGKADFFGHPFSHPLAETYFSQAPIRFGDYVAKLGAFPASEAQVALETWRLDPDTDEDGFRHAATAFFRNHEVIYELRAQLWSNADTQPIEDASVEWPVAESPYQTVAILRLPAQDAYSPARQRYFDEEMTFRLANSLLAHQPLGSVMRARLQVYRALAAFRQHENGVVAAAQRDISEIPV